MNSLVKKKLFGALKTAVFFNTIVPFCPKLTVIKCI